MTPTRPRKFGRGFYGILATTCTSLPPTAPSQRQIKRGSHYSVRELESVILEFIEVHNEQLQPFVWTKSADATLNRIGRFASPTMAAHGPNNMSAINNSVD